MKVSTIVCVALVGLLPAGCGMFAGKEYSRPLPEGQVALKKITDPTRIPDFRRALTYRAGLVESIDKSLAYFTHPSSERYFPYLDITHSRAVHSLERFKELLATAVSANEFQRRIVEEFDVYESVGCDGRGTVLFTGYCTPIYEASIRPTPEFKYPLYKLPPDLVKTDDGRVLGRQAPSGTVEYYTRAQIENRKLLEGQELVYLKDRLEAFLVHVQGSARLRLTNGSMLEIGYAGKNGREYSSLGKMLVAEKKLHRDRVSLTTIKQYFKKHPEDLDVFLPRNESFIFFRETQGGPYGSLGQPVTAYRSIATDKNKGPDQKDYREAYPRGCLAFIQTNLPTASPTGRIEKHPYSGFILDQDSGGAIRSAGRADVYLGVGRKAELLAGYAVSEGRIYYLFAKTVLLQRRL